MTTTSPVVERLLRHLREQGRDARVESVRVGLGYTAALLDDGRAGLAFTFRNELPGGCTVSRAAQAWAGQSALELAAGLASEDRIEAAVGLACANALSNDGDYREGDVLEQVGILPADRVGMVGFFGPLVAEIRSRARSLTVFEQKADPSRGLQPMQRAASELPRCQVALITATAIINHTIEGMLEAAKSCREVVILGASTPLVPEAFVGTGVTLLSGVVVSSPQEVLRVVSEAGGMRRFKPYVRKVGLALT